MWTATLFWMSGEWTEPKALPKPILYPILYDVIPAGTFEYQWAFARPPPEVTHVLCYH